MATWATPLADLRVFLADGPNDNLVKDRPVLGNTQDGWNRTFFTFDDRLLASGYQSACGTPLRAFWDSGSGPVELAASGILIIDQVRGEFQTMFVPSGIGKLTASYHFQKHFDSDLNVFLQQAASQMGTDVASDIAAGLQAGAVHIAASMAHSRLAQRWQQRKSQQFMLQDEPMRQEAEELIKFHQAESARLMTIGLELRQTFYKMRQDRGFAPAYGTLARKPRNWTPDR